MSIAGEKDGREADGGAAPGRSYLLAVGGVVLLALVLRVAYLFEIEEVPFFYSLIVDARGYDAWASRIAAGDWIGREVFYQAPLYPYFLACLQLVIGHDLFWIRVVQAAIGAASCGLVAAAGRAFISPRAGIAAGLLLALYPPAIFFDGLIQKAGLVLALSSLLLVLLGAGQRRPRSAVWLAAGLVLGLLALTWENALLVVPLVAVWLMLRFAHVALSTRLAWVAAAVGGMAVALAPATVRNLAVGGQFVLTTSQLGPNFFIGNNAQATGTYVPFRAGRSDPKYERLDATELAEQEAGRTLSPKEVSRHWLRRAWEYIRSRPGEWLRLTIKKWLLLWNSYELADAEDMYTYERWSWVLQSLDQVLHFGVLCPLAAAGVVLTRRRWRELWLLYALAATVAASVTAFYVLARYRVPLLPVLCVFAGAGVVQVAALMRARQWRACVVPAAVAAATALAVNWRFFPTSTQEGAAHFNLGWAYADQGRLDEAVEQYQEALAISPHRPETHYSLGTVLLERGELEQAAEHLRRAIQIAPSYADAYHNLGHVLRRLGRLDEAAEAYRQAIRLRPAFAEAYNSLGTVLAASGQVQEAIECYARSLELDARQPDVHFNLGVLVLQRREQGRALEHFREAIRLRPGYAKAHFNLGVVLQETGRLEEATVHYRRALEADPDFQAARINLGAALAESGSLVAAVEQLQRVLEREPENVAALSNLASAFEMLGRDDEAIDAYRRVVSRQPASSSTRLRLADLLVRRGRVPEATGLLEQWTELAPDEAPAWAALASAYAHAERWAEAVKAGRRARELAAVQQRQALYEQMESMLAGCEAKLRGETAASAPDGGRPD